MAYYLIDDNKVRSCFESALVYDDAFTINSGDFSIVVNNVQYVIDKKSLVVKMIAYLNDDAFVFTTEGLIRWNNPPIEMIEMIDGSLYYLNVVAHINFIGQYSKFCSGFICLGKLPSENPLKFTSKDIKIYNTTDKKIYSPAHEGFRVTETTDSIVIEIGISNSYTEYYIGPLIKDKMYVISHFSNLYAYMKKIIPKGTCFGTKLVITRKERNLQSIQTIYELCY